MIAHRSNCRVTILSNTSQPLTLTPAYWSSLRAMCRDKYPRDIPPRSFTLRPFGIGKNIAVCYGFPAYLETRGRVWRGCAETWTIPNIVTTLLEYLTETHTSQISVKLSVRIHTFPVSKSKVSIPKLTGEISTERFLLTM